MRLIQRLHTLLFLLLITAASAAAFGATDEVRYSLFNDIEEVFREANAAKANILAPDNYEQSADLYRSANERYERGQSIKKIRDELALAKIHLVKSMKLAAVAERLFGGTLEARNDAEAAQAEYLANADWQSAEKTFADAARRLEAGREEDALKQNVEAEKHYRTAELTAIKNNVLGETIHLIEQAHKDDVGRYAPVTLAKAESLLTEAERELIKNRYAPERARSLGAQASQEAKRAAYIAFQIKSLRYRDLTEEDLIQRSEQSWGSGQSWGSEQALDSRFSEVKKLFSHDEGNVLVLAEGGNIVIRTFGLNFSPGSSEINSQYYPLLRKVQDAIRLFPDTQIVVQGHTDSVGDEERNLDLSVNRAQAVRQYLLYNMEGLRGEQIEVVGYGENLPIGNNETAEGRTKNRRVDVILRRY